LSRDFIIGNIFREVISFEVIEHLKMYGLYKKLVCES